MKDQVKTLIDKLPAAWLRSLVFILIVGIAAVGYPLERDWRAARVKGEAELTVKQQAQAEAIAGLIKASEAQVESLAACREELKEYREEMRQLRKDQIEWARQLERALRDGR